MAGYMRKLNGYVYDGAHTAKVAMANGIFAGLVKNNTTNEYEVQPIAEAGDMELRVEEKTTLWGQPALVLNVVVPGTKEHYFVENEWDVNEMETYDEANYTCKVGDYVRMHRPVINDQLIMTVGDTLYGTLAVGDVVKPAVGGTVAQKTA